MPQRRHTVMKTPFTTEYRGTWGYRRMVLDSVSNHLPADSLGTETKVLLRQDGHYVDLKSADPAKPTEEVVFRDNGPGYPREFLVWMHSTKTDDPKTVGQFGEGLKLAALAALRSEVSLEYRSRDTSDNWTAGPFKEPASAGSRKVELLCYEIKDDEGFTGSQTVFKNPNPELLKEVFGIPENVLFFNNIYRELYSEKDNLPYSKEKVVIEGGPRPKRYLSRIIDTGKGSSLFVKGIKLRDVIPSIFSYDLGTQDIAPDRNLADMEIVVDEIEHILKGCSNPEIVKKVLMTANERPNESLLEFSAFSNIRKVDEEIRRRKYGFTEQEQDAIGGNKKAKKIPKNLWAKTFRDIWGEKAVIASGNVNKNKEAELMGYNPVLLDGYIGRYLADKGIMTADGLVKGTGYKWIDESELTGEEKEMISRAEEINRTLSHNRILTFDFPIRVYSHALLPDGEEAQETEGVFDKQGRFIGIRRDQLVNFRTFAEVYVHELGHGVTNKGDYDREFTDYFVKAAAALISSSLSRETPEPETTEVIEVVEEVTLVEPEIVEHVEDAMPEPLIMAKRRAEGQVPVEVPLTPEHENGIDKTIKEIFERYL